MPVVELAPERASTFCEKCVVPSVRRLMLSMIAWDGVGAVVTLYP
jgi:hypothetical protein